MWVFLRQVWENSYHGLSWWQIAISLAATLPIVCILLAFVIEVPIGFLYALFVWNPDRDLRHRNEKRRKEELRNHPEIAEARVRYKASREEMMKTLEEIIARYPFVSGEDTNTQWMMRRMEHLWEQRGRWSPYAFWVLWDNQIVIRTYFTPEDCEVFEEKVNRVYQDWHTWMRSVSFCPDYVWVKGDKQYDWRG